MVCSEDQMMISLDTSMDFFGGVMQQKLTARLLQDIEELHLQVSGSHKK